MYFGLTRYGRDLLAIVLATDEVDEMDMRMWALP